MATVKIGIKNLPQIRAAFKKSPRILAKNLRKGIYKSLLTVERQSIINAPRDSGYLKSSHRSRMVSNTKGIMKVEAKYAGWVHDGHIQQVGRFVPAIGKRLVQPYVKGNPFLSKAVAEKQGSVDKILKGAVQDTLDEIARSTS